MGLCQKKVVFPSRVHAHTTVNTAQNVPTRQPYKSYTFKIIILATQFSPLQHHGEKETNGFVWWGKTTKVYCEVDEMCYTLI